MFDFGEKQGRLCIRLDIYLKKDLDNNELEKVFDKISIVVKHPLATGDFEIEAVTD